MSKAAVWSEVKPRFTRMVLAVGFRPAARRMRVSKSTLYNWFHGAGRAPGAPPIEPSRARLRCVLSALVRWERDQARVRTLTPHPVWTPPRWTNQGRCASIGASQRYR